MIDIVTVTHNSINEQQAVQLQVALNNYEDPSDYTFYVHSNRTENLGFGKACNLAAFREGAKSPIIGFLNPDVVVQGKFTQRVMSVFDGEPNTVIAGNRFEKPQRELDIWGVRNWVCGAVFFVRRNWFTSVGGFDENYVWSWEETDLIRTAESNGLRVHSIKLQITHESPSDDADADAEYKLRHFKAGQAYYAKKWRK
jgi:GT2 family glycosyltransferase